MTATKNVNNSIIFIEVYILIIQAICIVKSTIIDECWLTLLVFVNDF